MFNHRHYVPILKWKQGEYLALERLAEEAKAAITPLIEIPPIGYDYAKLKKPKTLDDHLEDFGKQLNEKWQGRHCFVDLGLLGVDAKMANGQHCVGFVLGKARENQCLVIPVVRMDSSALTVSVTAAAIGFDKRGVCLRLVALDFDRPNLVDEINGLLNILQVSPSSADLVIDFGAYSYPSSTIFTQTASAMMGMLPYVNQWRTLTIAGSSYPQTITQSIQPPSPKGDAEIKHVSGYITRREWVAYKALVAHAGSNSRIPTFGDYATTYPDILDLDMRNIKPLAKLRYTIEDAWYIGLGQNVRNYGFGQYGNICEALVASPCYDGAYFSAADSYIKSCSTKAAKTGNLTTWVWIATNRHLTKMVADLSSHFGT